MLINDTQTVKLDANGDGQLRIAFPGKHATIRRITLSTSPATRETLGVVYRDFIGPPYMVDSTYTAGTGDTSDTVHIIPDGHCLFVTWEKGDAHAQATATYSGEVI